MSALEKKLLAALDPRSLEVLARELELDGGLGVARAASLRAIAARQRIAIDATREEP